MSDVYIGPCDLLNPGGIYIKSRNILTFKSSYVVMNWLRDSKIFPIPKVPLGLTKVPLIIGSNRLWIWSNLTWWTLSDQKLKSWRRKLSSWKRLYPNNKWRWPKTEKVNIKFLVSMTGLEIFLSLGQKKICPYDRKIFITGTENLDDQIQRRWVKCWPLETKQCPIYVVNWHFLGHPDRF